MLKLLPAALGAIGALLGGWAFFPVSAQEHDSSPPPNGTDYQHGVEKATFLLVNDYRKSKDLPALIWSDSIAAEAREHSKDMASGEVDFGHDGFGGRIDRLRSVLTGLRGAGENVLMTSNLDEVARSALTMWLGSPHHLKNIRGDYNYSGMGVWQNKDGAIYFTQIFVKLEPQTTQVQTGPAVFVSPFGMLANPDSRSGR
jgi:uncharacterized protein YkwD